MRVTVKEWAARNGVSERAVRARLARGTLPGTKERDPGTGAELWYVDVPERTGLIGPDNDYLVISTEGLDSLVALVREKDQTILELAGRCGFLQARVQELERENLLLKAPVPHSETVPSQTANPNPPASSANGQDSGAECPPPRPWWKFWV